MIVINENILRLLCRNLNGMHTQFFRPYLDRHIRTGEKVLIPVGPGSKTGYRIITLFLTVKFDNFYDCLSKDSCLAAFVVQQ